MNNNTLIINNNENTMVSRIVVPQDKHFIRFFLELKGAKSLETKNAYQRDIKQYYNVESVEDITMDMILDVSILSVENWIMQMKEEGKSGATINRKVSSLSSLYKWLLKYVDNRSGKRIIISNPFAAMKEEKPEINNKPTSFLNEDQAHKLVSSIETETLLGLRNKIIISLILTCGLRKSELINIKIKDMMNINGYNTMLVHGKGSKDRSIKVQNGIKAMIDDYLERTSRNIETSGEEYLFIGASSNGLNADKLSKNAINNMLTKACNNAEVPVIVVHGLRHSSITIVYKKTKDPKLTQEFAGHSQFQTTERYIHSVMSLENNPTDLINVL
jgi:site-specific recombinase XerD